MNTERSQPRERGQWLRRLLLAIARVSSLALPAAVVGYAGDWHWMLDLFSHFRWQYAFALGAGMGAALLVRRPGLALTLALGLAVNTWTLLTATGPVPIVAAAGSDAGHGFSLSMLVANIHVDQRNVEPLLELVELEDPDLVGIIELTPAVAAELERRLASRYPIHRAQTRDDPFGMGIWSRVPASRIEAIETPPLSHPILILEAEGLGQFWLVHPFPPISARASHWRDSQLADLADRIGTRGDQIVAGDLNASPWSAAYRTLRERTGLLDSSAGNLPWPTWFGPGGIASLFAVPIDHVLHGDHWRVLDYRIGPEIGSDHRPLIVRLERAGSAAMKTSRGAR